MKKMTKTIMRGAFLGLQFCFLTAQLTLSLTELKLNNSTIDNYKKTQEYTMQLNDIEESVKQRLNAGEISITQANSEIEDFGKNKNVVEMIKNGDNVVAQANLQTVQTLRTSSWIMCGLVWAASTVFIGTNFIKTEEDGNRHSSSRIDEKIFDI